MTTANNHPTVFMMLGYPGAGKTFFARQYAAEKGIPLVSADRLRFELYEEPSFSKEEDKTILNLMDYMIDQYLNAGLSVVVDGLNSTRVRRHSLREVARKYRSLPLVIWVQTDIETALNRAITRDRRSPDDKFSQSIDEETFERLKNAIKQPQHEDYVVVSGKHVYVNQRNAVDKKISAMKFESAASRSKKVSLGGRVDLNRRRTRTR